MNKTSKEKNNIEKSVNPLSICCGTVIRNIRKANGLTGAQLAKKLGISQQQMSRYERGINNITLDMLFNMTTVLNVPFEDVFNEILFVFQCSESDNEVCLKNKIKSMRTVYFY